MLGPWGESLAPWGPQEAITGAALRSLIISGQLRGCAAPELESPSNAPPVGLNC
jgi:hypothetical protein